MLFPSLTWNLTFFVCGHIVDNISTLLQHKKAATFQEKLKHFFVRHMSEYEISVTCITYINIWLYISAHLSVAIRRFILWLVSDEKGLQGSFHTKWTNLWKVPLGSISDLLPIFSINYFCWENKFPKFQFNKTILSKAIAISNSVHSMDNRLKWVFAFLGGKF